MTQTAVATRNYNGRNANVSTAVIPMPWQVTINYDTTFWRIRRVANGAFVFGLIFRGRKSLSAQIADVGRHEG